MYQQLRCTRVRMPEQLRRSVSEEVTGPFQETITKSDRTEVRMLESHAAAAGLRPASPGHVWRRESRAYRWRSS